VTQDPETGKTGGKAGEQNKDARSSENYASQRFVIKEFFLPAGEKEFFLPAK
jgi:hypothetical protein